MPIINSLRRAWKQSISSIKTKPSPVLNIKDGEVAVVTYTSAVDKMKVFSAFVREGLENGDLVDYGYPDEESGTIRAKLEEYGVDVEKYEREGALVLDSLTEWYLPDGKFDVERAISMEFQTRTEAKRKGYKHYKALEDLGDFSFLDGQWQRYIEYWDNPAWETPSSSNIEILDYTPFVTELDAFNVEGIGEVQLAEMLKAFWVGSSFTMFIDLLEHTNAFSKLLGIPHKKLVGRKILLEFSPSSDYEIVIDNLAKEAVANVCPIFVFTSTKSSLHAVLAKQSAIEFFLLSHSISMPELTSDNEILLPANNTALILDSLSQVLEKYADINIFVVFDKISEFIGLVGFDRTYKLLFHMLDMLPPKKTTAFFLLNKSAHEPQVVSRIQGLFHNLLTYNKNGLEVVKTS